MLSVIITLFAFPIGLFVIFKEIKDHKHYEAVFDDYVHKINIKDMNASDKIAQIRKMLEHNHYHVLSLTDSEIEAERKIFSAGWLIFSLGFFYLGALVYVFYFYKVQKPHRVCYELE